MASTNTGTSSSPSAAAAAAATTTATTAATNILPRIVTLSEIETITSQPSFQIDLIAAISDGFVAYHQGDFFAAPIQTLGVSPPFGFQQNQQEQGGEEEVISNNNYVAQTCVKSGYFRNNPYYVIKVASGGYPFATNSGNMQVYSQQTGFLQAILLDEGLLTELRTAAIGALAFTHFAPAPHSAVTCIGMVGTGVQARFQLQWLTLVTDCRNLILYGRSPEKVQGLQAELEKSGWTVVITSQADDLLSLCDVIITTTSAREYILGRSCTSVDWFTLRSPHRTRLIICIGADAPGKKELAFLLVEQAHVLVADCLKQTRERGEFRTWCRCKHAAAEMGELEKLFSLGQILAEQRNDLLRNNNKNDDEDADEDNRLYIFDSSGVALQDCVIAQMVYEALSTGPSSSS